AQADDQAFRLDRRGEVRFSNAAVARLAHGSPLLAPKAQLVGGESGEPALRARAQLRIETWLSDLCRRELAALAQLDAALRDGALRGAARGVAYLLRETLGAIDRREAGALASALDPDSRRSLAALGVRIGRHSIYLPRLIQPRASRLLAALRFGLAGGE